MAFLGLRQRAIGSILVRSPNRTGTATATTPRPCILHLQPQRHRSSTSATAASNENKLPNQDSRPEGKGPPRTPPLRDDHASESDHLSRHASDSAQLAAAPAEAAPPVAQPLPGQMAKLLNLVDTHMKPKISYLPDEALFVYSRPGKGKDAPFEHRGTVNPQPNQRWKIKMYDQMRKSMISLRSVHHRHFKGTLFSAVQRLFGLQGATAEFHGPLGKRWAKNEEIDESRIVRFAYRPRVFERDNTAATVETLPTGQAALLWINMVPTRWQVRETFPLPKDEHPQSHFKWAHLPTNLPWNVLADILERSPTHTLKTPSESPSSPDYQVWPAEARLDPPISNKEVAERAFLMHVMPLFLESYGKGGRLARKLWDNGRRNDNLPVVFSWQEKYIWCIWRNGPHGPLEMQQTGDWIPQINPGQINYEVEQKLLRAWQDVLNGRDVKFAFYDCNDPESYQPRRRPNRVDRLLLRRGESDRPNPQDNNFYKTKRETVEITTKSFKRSKLHR